MTKYEVSRSTPTEYTKMFNDIGCASLIGSVYHSTGRINLFLKDTSRTIFATYWEDKVACTDKIVKFIYTNDEFNAIKSVIDKRESHGIKLIVSKGLLGELLWIIMVFRFI